MTDQTHTALIQLNYRWIDCTLCRNFARKYNVSREELFATVLEKLWRYRHRFKQQVGTLHESYRSWANVITSNAAIDIAKKKMIRQVQIDAVIMRSLAYQYRATIEHTWDDDAHADLMLTHINTVFGHIAFMSCHLLREGLTIEEVSKLLGKQKSTIYRLLKQIRNDITKLTP